MKKTFTYVRVQSGYWGSTELDRVLRVNASTEGEADAKVNSRADAYKRLKNGDRQMWRLMAQSLAG